MNIARCFALLLIAGLASAQVKISREPDRVAVEIDGKPGPAFMYGADVSKPYLWPLTAADGTEITRGWPMRPREGERHDHIHHRGLWFAHSSVNGFDFWNSDPSYHNPKMGRIEVVKIDSVKSGKREGSIKAELRWLSPTGEELIHESRVMTFYAGNPRLIDLDFTLTARRPVIFGDDKDGVLGIRLAPELEENAKDAPPGAVRSGVMTDAEGCAQEAGCWGKRSPWIDVSGTLRGETLGVAIFDNPSNPRAPTYWHARGYGLLAANVFGVKAFERDPSKDGSLSVPEGGVLRFRYRVVVHSGNAADAGLARLYADYARASLR